MHQFLLYFCNPFIFFFHTNSTIKKWGVRYWLNRSIHFFLSCRRLFVSIKLDTQINIIYKFDFNASVSISSWTIGQTKIHASIKIYWLGCTFTGYQSNAFSLPHLLFFLIQKLITTTAYMPKWHCPNLTYDTHVLPSFFFVVYGLKNLYMLKAHSS